MLHERAKIEVTLRIDPVPGTLNNPEDFVRLILEQLVHSVPHYLPEVRLVGRYIEENPGFFHTVEEKLVD